jgi:hypothetical protein
MYNVSVLYVYDINVFNSINQKYGARVFSVIEIAPHKDNIM